MNIYWTRKAQRDLLNIGHYIGLDNPAAAKRTVFNIRKRVLKLKKNSYIGRRVPETAEESIREILYGNYRIVYKVKSDSIDILMVFEGHKLLKL